MKDVVAALPEVHLSTVLEIGGVGAEGPGALGSISTAALLGTSDRLAVVDGQTQEIHIFGMDGILVGTLGGEGSGPGEFRAIRSLRPTHGGGLCVWDAQAGRVTTFGPAGEVESTARAQFHGLLSPYPEIVGFLEDCSFLVRDRPAEMNMRDQPQGMRRDTVVYVQLGADGEQMRVVSAQPDAARWLRNDTEAWGYVEPIFGRRLTAFVLGQDLWVGYSDSLAWSVHPLDESEAQHLVIPVVAREADPHEIAMERVRRHDAVPRRSSPMFERLAEQERVGIRMAPFYETLPVYDAVVPATATTFWLREFPRPQDGEARWFKIEPGTGLTVRLRLPRRDMIIAADEARLVVSSVDSSGAPVLRVLEVSPN